MILPIGDNNPRSSIPVLSWSFLGAHLVLSMVLVASPGSEPLSWFAYGRPAVLVSSDPSEVFYMPVFHELLLFFFVLFNLCFLWVFADNLEDRFGKPLFALFYIGSGGVGLILQGLTRGDLATAFPQAAIAAVVWAYVVLFPRHEVIFLNLLGEREEAHLAWGKMSGRAGTGGILWAAAQAVGLFLFHLSPAPLLAGAGIGVAAALLYRGRHPDLLGHALEIPGGYSWAQEENLPGELPRPRPPEAAGVTPRQEGDWAVIRLTDELRELGRLGRIVCEHTGEMLYQVTRRLREARGVLATGLDEEAARRLAAEAGAIGIEATAVPWDASLPPAAQQAVKVAWSERSVALELDDGRTLDIPWRRVLLAAGTRITRRSRQMAAPDVDLLEASIATAFGAQPRSSRRYISIPRRVLATRTRIDLLVETGAGAARAPARRAPPLRLRVEGGVCSFAVAGPPKSGFRELARAILGQRGIVPVNPGIGLIARSGRWGYLRFEDERSHDLYIAWLITLLCRSPAPEAEATYLE